MWTRAPNSWVDLVDPTDPQQLGKGSLWPLIADSWIQARGAPIGFVPAAGSGTTGADWMPGALYYNLFKARAQSVGVPITAVVMWLGTNDAALHVDGATFHSQIAAITAQIFADFGCPTYWTKMPMLGFVNHDIYEPPINAAIVQAWSDVPHAMAGPDLSDMTADDSFHLTTDPHMRTVASRFYTVLNAGTP